MSSYSAPLRDMRFLLVELGLREQVAQLPGHDGMSEDLVEAILTEAARFSQGVLAPLNVIGDRDGARWQAGDVYTAPGWCAAYKQFAANGWNALSCPSEFGGQGAPRLVSDRKSVV